MNIAQQYAKTMLIRRGRSFVEEDDRDTYTNVFPLFHEAEAKINERLGIVKGEYSQAIQTGATDFFYPRPADLVGYGIESAALYFSDGSWQPLEKKDEDPFAFGRYAPFTNPNRERAARHFWMSRDTYQVGIGWPPQQAGSLKMRYVRDPDPIEEDSIYAQKVITAAVDAAGVVVTFSAPIPPGVLGDDFQIGFSQSLLQSRLRTPTSWYYVDGVTTNGDDEILTASISEAKKYRGVRGVSGLYFAATKLSDIQKQSSLSALTGELAVFYALSQLFEEDDPGRAAMYAEKFETRLAQAVPNEANLIIPSFDGNSCPWGDSL